MHNASMDVERMGGKGEHGQNKMCEILKVSFKNKLEYSHCLSKSKTQEVLNHTKFRDLPPVATVLPCS